MLSPSMSTALIVCAELILLDGKKVSAEALSPPPPLTNSPDILKARGTIESIVRRDDQSSFQPLLLGSIRLNQARRWFGNRLYGQDVQPRSRQLAALQCLLHCFQIYNLPSGGIDEDGAGREEVEKAGGNKPSCLARMGAVNGEHRGASEELLNGADAGDLKCFVDAVGSVRVVEDDVPVPAPRLAVSRSEHSAASASSPTKGLGAQGSSHPDTSQAEHTERGALNSSDKGRVGGLPRGGWAVALQFVVK